MVTRVGDISGGGTLLVEKNATLPEVCVKCGVTSGLTRKRQRFQYTPPWGFVFFGLTGFVAYPDPTIAMFGSLSPLFGLACVLLTTRRAEIEIELCAPCKQRWTTAVIVLGLAVLAPFVGL